MSKFKKRIQKTFKKHIENAVTIGFSKIHAEEIIETFNTVFVVDRYDIPPKHKNIIHVFDINFLENVYGVDIIFIDQMYEPSNLTFFPTLLRRLNPVVLLQEEFAKNELYPDALRKLRYEHVDFFGDYQVWKIVRR